MEAKMQARFSLCKICIVVLLSTVINGTAYSESGKAVCKLGVFPFLSSQRLEKIFAPIAAEMDKVLACDLSYHSAATYKAFMEKLSNREFQIAYIQPFDYVRLAVPKGYLPLMSRSSRLISTIVSRQDSGINSLSDLKGKIIALPPSVAAVSYLTKAALEEAGIDSVTEVTLDYSKNHGSCMQKVLIGKADACGTVNTVIKLFENKYDIKLKVVATTPAIPQSLFVIRGDIPESTRKKLQQQLLNIKLNNDGLRLFKASNSNEIFIYVRDEKYDTVRKYWQHFKLP